MLAALAAGAGLGVIAAVIWTIGNMLAAPPNAEIDAELAPLALRGRDQAVFYLGFPAAAFLAPALGGAVLQCLGDAHWSIVAPVGVAAGHLMAGTPVAAVRDETVIHG